MITDQLTPNLQYGPGTPITQGQPYAGDGSRMVDFPYIYVYDGTVLTDGTTPQNRSLSIKNDADFYLRRIFGVPYVSAKFRFRQQQGRPFQESLENFPYNYTLNREILFPADSQIGLDFGTISKLQIDPGGGNPVYGSYIGFQGVKRQMLSIPPYETPYAPYKRLPYTYTFTLTIDWTYYASGTTQEPPRAKYVDINNYDFELHTIEVLFSDGTFDKAGLWQIILYDAYQNPTSNLPVSILGENYIGQTDSATPVLLNSVFPVPPLVYPSQSVLRFDVKSLIFSAVPKIYSVRFHGMQRYPIGTGQY